MEEQRLLACSPSHAQPVFLYIPGPPAQGWSILCLGIPTPILNHGNTLKNSLQANPMETFSGLGPFPHDCALYQANTNLAAETLRTTFLIKHRFEDN